MSDLRLGRNNTGTLTGIVGVTGSAYRLMVQGRPEASALHGVRLEPHPGLILRVDGAVRPLADNTPITFMQSIALTVSQAGLNATVPGNGVLGITLLALLGGSWQVAASWRVSIHTVLPLARHEVLSVTHDTALVIFRSPSETTETVFMRWDAGEVSQPWAGFRDQTTGARAWLFPLVEGGGAIPLLPEYTAIVQDNHGNSTELTVTIPPPKAALAAPALSWPLPFWLPPTGELGHIISTFEEGLENRPRPMLAVNPRLAEGDWLTIHARLGGVGRSLGESDSLLRLRATALADRRHLNARSLEHYLAAVAGVPVRIGDQLTNVAGEALVRLTGTHRLDGSWTLGGAVGGDLPAGRFVVRLEETPAAPMELVRYELERLRPAGRLTTLEQVRSVSTPLSQRLTGVLEQSVQHGIDTTLFAGFRRLDGTWQLDGAVTLRQAPLLVTFV